MANTWPFGSIVTCTGVFKVTGTLTSANNVWFGVQDPQGSESGATPGYSAEITGHFFNITATAAGRWRYQFSASGAVQAASANYFDVAAKLFA